MRTTGEIVNTIILYWNSIPDWTLYLTAIIVGMLIVKRYLQL
ncbi:hypothetical protein [Syntrophus aciditrophicus]|jgi:hypothetical protein|nr:hypothetical protein [Syntrophus aciditrophicus]OPY17534.1 MAG: hypothetical protein A4E74_01165 [Syntrophus sp. PtaB.Bin075]